MAFIHGKNTNVLVDEFDLTAYLNQGSVSKKAQAVKTTVFGLDDHTYIGGLEEGSASLGGLFDGAASAVDEVLNTALGGTQVVTVAWPGYATIGNAAAMLQSKQASYQIRAINNDAVRVNAGLTGDTGVRFGLILHPLVARTAGANFTSVDNTASTSSGSVAQLHVTAFTGTNATVKVTDSTDDSIFADLHTFSSVSGVTSERSTATGTVNRYARVELTGTFTTITFAVSFVRNKHTN
jgi:hypothetical protein